MKIVTKIFVSCLFLCVVLLPAQAQLTQEEKAKCKKLIENKDFAVQECRNALQLLEDVHVANDNPSTDVIGGSSGADLDATLMLTESGNMGISFAGYSKMSPELKGEWKKKAASFKSTFLANSQEFDKQYEALDEDQKAILYAAAQEEYKESVALVAQQLLSRVSAITGGKKADLSVNELREVLEKGKASTVSATLDRNTDGGRGLGSYYQKVDEEASAASEKVAKYAAFLEKVKNCTNCKPTR